MNIPDIGSLGNTANEVLRRVPDGLTRGEIATGLFGLGFVGRWALPRIKQRGVKVVSCFDANEALAGTCAEGVPVRLASELKSRPPEFIIVSARHATQQVASMLGEIGIPHISYDAWEAASDFDAFRQVHDALLTDDRSKQVLRAVLTAMLTGDAKSCEGVCEPDQYFCLPRFRGPQAENYVDAGAFDGDSAEAFIIAHDGVVSKIHAFEPGARQFSALQARVERLAKHWALKPGAIATINAGLGVKNATARGGTGNGQLTSFTVEHGPKAEGSPVQIVRLDDYLKGQPISFLKADVEGMEMALLWGAEASIRAHKPKIAICVYHYPKDIPEIANAIRALVPDYRFALRHHSLQLMETVLYCWIDR